MWFALLFAKIIVLVYHQKEERYDFLQPTTWDYFYEEAYNGWTSNYLV